MRGMKNTILALAIAGALAAFPATASRIVPAQPSAFELVNLRMETSTIGSRNRQHGISCVELIAYGTAIKYQR